MTNFVVISLERLHCRFSFGPMLGRDHQTKIFIRDQKKYVYFSISWKLISFYIFNPLVKVFEFNFSQPILAAHSNINYYLIFIILLLMMFKFLKNENVERKKKNFNPSEHVAWLTNTQQQIDQWVCHCSQLVWRNGTITQLVGDAKKLSLLW